MPAMEWNIRKVFKEESRVVHRLQKGGLKNLLRWDFYIVMKRGRKDEEGKGIYRVIEKRAMSGNMEWTRMDTR